MSNATTRKPVRFTLDPANPPQLTPEQAKHLDALADADIDLSDTPELTPEFWKRVNTADEGKAQITLRIDRDVLDYFRHGGKRYQTRINHVLRAYMQAHSRPSAKR